MSNSSSSEMWIVFIHSGKKFFKTLGPHYSNLIKKKLSLLPINQYLRLSSVNKDKFRAIEALPTGAIVGVALIDKSFWFAANHLNDPWAHGPYCYHIIDAFRIKKPIEYRGLPGIWTVDKKTRTVIESLDYVNSKMTAWKNQYNVSKKTDYCLTVMQPFAESIVRKIKTVENRGARLFIVSSNDGEFKGCRVCLSQNNVQNYENMEIKNNKKWNKNIPKYTKNTNFSYHPSATLTQCQCKKGKKRTRNDTKIQKRKTNKMNLKPLPNYNAMTKRRKPSKMRNTRVTKIKYGKYYDNKSDSEFIADCGELCKDKTYNFRHKKGGCYSKLLQMGYSKNLARRAAQKYTNVDECVLYLCKLQKVEESSDISLGYSDKLSTNKDNGNIVKNMSRETRKNKRKRELIEIDSDDSDDIFGDNHNHKVRKLDNGDKYTEYREILDHNYDETVAIERAIKESQSTYVVEAKWAKCRHIMNEKHKENKICNETKENLERNRRRKKKLYSRTLSMTLRKRCD